MVSIRDGDEGLSLERVGRTEEGDVRLRASIASLGFFGSHDEIWVSAADVDSFLHQLTVLEQQRRGEALLESMSPSDLRLAVAATDSSGHVSAIGFVGRIRGSERSPIHARLGFHLDVDPGHLRELVRSFTHVLAG